MRVCNRCVLNDHNPGVSFDEHGTCNFCKSGKTREDLRAAKKRYEQKFRDVISTHKGKNSYDCLIGFSGGKDSTYTLSLMKEEYDLRILAVSFDNWFQSGSARDNIRKVLVHVGVDHLTLTPNFETFKRAIHASVCNGLYTAKALERASAICTTCLSLIRFSCFRIAIEKGIPFVIFAMSPGQAPLSTAIFKTNPEMMRKMQDAIFQPLYRNLGEAIRPFFLEEWHFERQDRFPYSINPLAFLDYDEEAMIARIERLGWQSPPDTDPNSTNCLLNALANQVHLEKHGYHPYAMELAELVREGVISREDALRRLSEPSNPEIVSAVREKLGLLPAAR